MMNYYNGVQSFINYSLSNSRNISEGGIRCPYKRCKSKKNSQLRYYNDAFSIKKCSWKNTCVDNIILP
jgi:hypothetical protein